jgi:hypothetical protein
MHKITRFMAIGLTPALFAPVALMAGSAEMWGDLKPGPYASGFQTIERYDYSRVFRPKKDYFGRLMPGERARPMQVCIWYPAQESGLSPMVYGEYVFPYPDDSRFIDHLGAIQGREIGGLRGLLENNQGAVLDLLSVKVGAINDAPPADGLFPLVIYCPEFGAGIAENFILCEYLASRGFIVAATHSVGSSTLSPALVSGDLESSVRDMEFVISTLRDFPAVDSDKLGVIGFFGGGLSASLLQMRSSDIDAMVSISGSYQQVSDTTQSSYDLVKSSPHFYPERVITPMMLVYVGTNKAPDFRLRDSLIYSTRYTLRMEDTDPVDFSGYGAVFRLNLTGAENPPPSRKDRYEALCRYVYHFLNASLNGSEENRGELDEGLRKRTEDDEYVTLTIQAASDYPPTPEQFMSVINGYGIARAYELYQKFKDSGRVFFQEIAFNALGYRLFQRGDLDNAILIFEMNADAYPDSPNTWDSLGEACEAAGRTQEAIKHLRKVLELLPSDTTTNEQFKEVIKNHAEEALRRLEG